MYSYDGIEYTSANNSSLLTTCHKIIWGNDNVFIAVGEGSSNTLIHSFDGVNWIQNNKLFTTAGYDVVYNNSIYLALGTGEIAY